MIILNILNEMFLQQPSVDPIPLWLYVVLFILGTIISSGVGIAAVYIAVKKTPFDVQKIRTDMESNKADYSAKIQDIATEATGENLTLRRDISSLHTEIELLKREYKDDLKNIKEAHQREMDELRKLLEAAKSEASRWRVYSQRLIVQMKEASPDTIPVSIEPQTIYGKDKE